MSAPPYRYSKKGYPKSTSKRPRKDRLPAASPAVRQAMTYYAPRPGPDTEYKVTDSGSSGTVSTSGTMVNLLSSLARGDGILGEFQGGRITPRGIQFRMTFTSADSTNVMRVMVFQWMDSSIPVVAGILQASTNCLSAVSITNRALINVLYDRVYTVSSYDGGTSNSYCLTFPQEQQYIKGKRMFPVEFASGTVAVQKGGLYCLLISDSSAISHPSVSFYFRTTFTDV